MREITRHYDARLAVEAEEMYTAEQETARKLAWAESNHAGAEKLLEDSYKLGEPGTEDSAIELAGYEIEPISAAMEACAGTVSVLRRHIKTRNLHRWSAQQFYESNCDALRDIALADAALAGVEIQQ